MQAKTSIPLGYSAFVNQIVVGSSASSSKPVKSKMNLASMIWFIGMGINAIIWQLITFCSVFFFYGFGSIFTSVRLILILVVIIASLISYIIPLTGQLKGIRRVLTIGFSSIVVFISPIAIYLFSTRIAQGPFARNMMKTPDTSITYSYTDTGFGDSMALHGLCLSFIFNLVPFMMSVFVHTKFLRNYVPYCITDADVYGEQIVTGQALENHAVYGKPYFETDQKI